MKHIDLIIEETLENEYQAFLNNNNKTTVFNNHDLYDNYQDSDASFISF